jgi:signal transduction histidine kinase
VQRYELFGAILSSAYYLIDLRGNPGTIISVRISRQALLASIVLIGLGQVAAAATETKRVVLLHSFGRDFLPWSHYSAEIRAELTRQSPWPIEIQDHSLMSARSSDEASERPFIDYLRAFYEKKAPDLIVSIGAPAAVFVQRHRQELFPGTPMLLTATEQRRVDPGSLSASDAVLAVKNDFAGVLKNILQVLPDTKVVAIVNGSSPTERFWRQEITREWKPIENHVSVIWWSDLSFESILAQAATLPPHSAIFWQLMNVDGAGVAHEGSAAFDRLRAIANAPIFSYEGSYLGKQIVGGPMYSIHEVSQAAAAVALRMLRGETPSQIKAQPVGFAQPKYDWRELKRWDISESRLPPGSQIYFREATAWQQYRWQMMAIGAAILLQAALISWLVYEHRRRHNAEVLARSSMSELQRLDRLATAAELSASIAHEVNQPLTGISTLASAALHWLARGKPDPDKMRDALTQILEASHSASELVTSVRAMFTKQSGNRVELDINALIRSVLAILHVELQKDRIEALTQLDPALPRIECDRVQLQQVLVNLIKNAIEAMHGEEARVLCIKTSLTQADVVNVSVQDSGCGIDPANVGNLFKALVTTKEKGMGMGLAICQSIIESHKGRIWASAAVGKGSVFQFELPCEVAAEPVRPLALHESAA